MNTKKMQAMLEDTAKGPDEKLAAFAAKLLAAMGDDEDQEGDDEKKTPAAPDTKRDVAADDEEDAPEGAKPAPKKASALVAHLARANERISEAEKTRRKERRAEILATLPRAVALSLATERLEVVERVAAKLGPRAPLDLATRMAGAEQPGVLASAPRGTSDPNFRPSRLPPAERAKLDERMGLRTASKGIERTDQFLTLDIVPRQGVRAPAGTVTGAARAYSVPEVPFAPNARKGG